MVDTTRTAADTPAAAFECVVERYDDQPDECTIFPADVPECRRLSTWISAKAGSYVDLRRWR